MTGAEALARELAHIRALRARVRAILDRKQESHD